MLELHGSVHRGESSGEIWFVEHEPVYTAGRATPPDQITAQTVEIGRGGQVTYHGPGQLVVYPIVHLPSKDVRAWLRALETFGVAVCSSFGLQGTASVDGTGVFVLSRKVASIGVAIRNWINLHGIALNVDMDLEAFGSIRPCGLDPAVISDLTRETGRTVSLEEVKEAARESLGPLLGF